MCVFAPDELAGVVGQPFRTADAGDLGCLYEGGDSDSFALDIRLEPPGTGMTDATLCDNSHGKDMEASKEWKQVKVAFKDLAQGAGWGKKFDFDAKEVIGIQWQVAQNLTFDLAIDNVGFY